jgi:hypothetical protein
LPGGYLFDADWLTRNPPNEDAGLGTVERERERAPTATGGAAFRGAARLHAKRFGEVSP